MSKHPHSVVFSDEPTFHQPGGYGATYRTDGLSAVDWLGNPFRLGDRVMYCIAAGRGQMMALGRVQQIRATEVDDWDYRIVDGERKWTKEGKRWEVEVLVLTLKTSGNWGNEKRTKPAWVNPMNITAFINPAVLRKALEDWQASFDFSLSVAVAEILNGRTE